MPRNAEFSDDVEDLPTECRHGTSSIMIVLRSCFCLFTVIGNTWNKVFCPNTLSLHNSSRDTENVLGCQIFETIFEISTDHL